MKSFSSIKKDLEFNKELSSLLNTMKDIAVSQFRALEQKLKSYDELFSTVDSFFELIDIEKVEHPFLKPGKNPQAVIAVTSDSGLLGGLNMQIINTAIANLERIPGKLIVIGERGRIYAQEANIPHVAFGGIQDAERYSQAMQLRDYAVGEVLNGSFSHVRVVYARPISFTVQRVEALNFVPFPAPELKKENIKKEHIADTIMESRAEDIVEYLVSAWMGRKLYDIFGLSRLSEFAARFTHLEDSSQRLKELDNKMQLEYFRARHELIDRNMRDLFAARLLYGKS